MSAIVVAGNTSGSVTLDAPAVAGTTVITLPATSGTMALAYVAPAFSAYSASQQSVTANTWTKAIFGTEEFDTNSNFATSRFTPTVAGYYQINATVTMNAYATNPTYSAVAIYKNGSAVNTVYIGTSANYASPTVSSIMSMNGTTDYIEIYGFNQSATGVFSPTQLLTFFNGAMIRSA